MRPAKNLRLRVLTEEETRQIHRTALKTLHEIGMDLQDDETRERLKDIGCRDGEYGNIVLTEEVVERAVSTVPPRMLVYDRNGNVAVGTDDATLLATQ